MSGMQKKAFLTFSQGKQREGSRTFLRHCFREHVNNVSFGKISLFYTYKSVLKEKKDTRAGKMTTLLGFFAPPVMV